MSFPERLRERGQLTCGYIVDTLSLGGVYGPNFNPYGEGPTRFAGYGKNQLILDNFSKHYHPGDFRLNPVEFRSLSGWGTKSSITSPYVYVTRRYRQVGDIALATMSPTTIWAFPDPTVEDPRRKDMALQSAFARIVTPDAEVGVMLAEARETLHMFVNPVKTLLKLVNGMVNPATLSTRLRSRTSRVEKYRKTPGYIRDAWLQTRFGILPLIKDITDLQKVFAKGFKQDLNVLRRASGGTSYDESHSMTRTVASCTNFSYEVLDVVDWKTTVTSTMYYNRQIYRNPLGLSPYDIPSIIYEMIPYSFVVDWSFNFGTWLRLIQPDPGMRYLGNHVSTKRVGTYHRTLLRGYPTGVGNAYAVPVEGQYMLTKSQMLRKVNATVPTLPVPNFGFESLVHGIDSISLIWQKMPKLRL